METADAKVVVVMRGDGGCEVVVLVVVLGEGDGAVVIIIVVSNSCWG